MKIEIQEQPTSWIGCKEKGKVCYERGQYEEALGAYKAALSPDFHAPRQERQIILSNIVACRLKIGGSAHAAAAVDAAKQCIELNPSWSKGHVRLACAYIALGGYSNDACNALQSALRLDPANSLARQMLARELRRDHAGAAAVTSEDHGIDTTAAAADAATPSENSQQLPFSHATTQYRDPPFNPAHVPSDRNDDESPRVANTPSQQVPDDPVVDGSLTVLDRLQFVCARANAWYSSQSDDSRMLVKSLMVVLLLYVGFGGRFGLDSLFSSTQPQRGNYGTGNAYDQYRRGTNTYSPGGSSDLYNRGTYRSGGGGYNDYSSTTTGYGARRASYSYPSGSSFGMLDGSSLTSLMILLGVAYMCHRNGINPLHAIWMMNVVGGRRRRLGFGGGFGGGYGGGAGMNRGRARW